MLAGIVESFRAVGGNHELVVISADPSYTISQHDVSAISRNDYRGMLNAIRQADAFLSGGGSLFQDATSARSALYYLAQFWYAVSIAGRPSIVFAQGIGPLRRMWVRLTAGSVLDRADLILLRDEPSKTLLAEIGVRRPFVEVTADPSFALPPVGKSEGKQFLEELGIRVSEPVIMVCPRPWESTRWNLGFIEALAAAVRGIGGTAIFMALHPSRDTLLARELARGVPNSLFIERVLTFRDIRTAIAGADMVISTRLHGLMFAVCEGIPAVGVSYDPKVEAFCRLCGLPYVRIGAFTPEEMLTHIRSAWEQRTSLAAAESVKSEELARAAFRNAELVCELL